MRTTFLYALLAVIVTTGFITGCNNDEVLLDEIDKTIESDTTVRVMNCVLDSSYIMFNTTSAWRAQVAKGGGSWCTLSKSSGPAGRDTIKIMVTENPTDSIRRTSVILESGTRRIVFRVAQKAGEAWFATDYWKRTALQRAGFRGRMESMTVTNKKQPDKSDVYSFDERGNVLRKEMHDSEFNRFDTTRTYTYDDANHRLSCVVSVVSGDTMRTWSYEYENTGRMVAFSARGWEDQNPLEEDMEGMVVPDLSAAYKRWHDEDYNYGEDRHYTFDAASGKLYIMRQQWREPAAGGEREDIDADTLKVEYRKGMPYNSKFVKNTTYQSNGMLRMVEKTDCKYEFMLLTELQAPHRMVPTYYEFKGTGEHLIDSCIYSYNYNRDLVERKVYYHGYSEATVEIYDQYDYDNYYNWKGRTEYVPYPGSTVAHPNRAERLATYY